MSSENESPNLIDRAKDNLNYIGEKGKETFKDARENISETARPKDSATDQAKGTMDDATNKGKEAIKDTRESVADTVKTEDQKTMFEKGKEYVDSASESVSNMFSSDKDKK